MVFTDLPVRNIYCCLTKSFNLTTLIKKTESNSLIVHDVYDTGHTLEKITHIQGSKAHVWISKNNPYGGIAINTSKIMNG